MKKKTPYWILVCIGLLATFLRFYQLANVPPSPSLDEVSIGYNAYSILTTGKDEYGTSYPLLLRAYDDWRPALYVYLVVPLIKIFGLSAISVRFPSAFLSVMTVFMTYFLVNELFRKSTLVIFYSLFTSFFLAVSPWHTYISRLGHEVNLGLFADVTATYTFLVSMRRKQPSGFFLSAGLFAIALYSYQSQKIIVPLLILALGLIYLRKLWQMRRTVVITVMLGALLILPLVKISLTPEALIRFRGTSAFTIDHPVFRENQEAFTLAKVRGDVIGQLKSHRLAAMLKIFWANYITHLDYNWLFLGTNRASHKVPNLGLMYWWELPLVMLGMLKLFFWKDLQSKRLIFFWLLISPIPAAITTQAPHAMRAFSVLPYLQILSALGTVSMIDLVGRKYYKFLMIIGVSIVTLSLGYLVQQYFVIFPKYQSDSFQYALAQSIYHAFDNGKNYERIIFSNRDNLSQSYMFFLFYSRYNPASYLAEGGSISGGFEQPHRFGNYEFRAIDWNKDSGLAKTIFYGNVNEFPVGLGRMAEFRYLDGKVGVVAISH